MARSHSLLAALGALVLQGAVLSPATAEPSAKPVRPVAWKAVESVDLAAFNKDLVAGKPTMDVVVYIPSNFDPSFNKLTLAQMLDGVRAAKEIYRPTGVQIHLLAVKTGKDARNLEPDYLTPVR